MKKVLYLILPTIFLACQSALKLNEDVRTEPLEESIMLNTDEEQDSVWICTGSGAGVTIPLLTATVSINAKPILYKCPFPLPKAKNAPNVRCATNT
ncbi:MAG: hypothetical protein IJU19_00600 [Bacteroidales bacterium]|nr:hypothetical protein [Bacteroidales bacterium]